jgi:hypothetical protein
MASEANGNASAAADTLTPAQQLLAKHTADEPHIPQVEDVVDEDDIAHPPPSSTGTHAASDAPPALSEIAKGKQKAQDIPETAKPAPPTLDTQSEEAFPSLGAPKSRGPVPMQWGKPPVIKPVNGTRGPVNGSGNISLSTAPTHWSWAHNSVAAKGPGISLPGRATERIQLANQQIATAQQLKKPIPHILNEINRRSKARVIMLEGPNNSRIFEATGPVEAVREALKEVATQVGSKVGNKANRLETLAHSFVSNPSRFRSLRPSVPTLSVAKVPRSKQLRRELVHASRCQSKTSLLA